MDHLYCQASHSIGILAFIVLRRKPITYFFIKLIVSQTQAFQTTEKCSYNCTYS